MKRVIVLLFLCHFFVDNVTAEHERHWRTLHGYADDSPEQQKRTVIIDRDDEVSQPHNIQKRSTVSAVNDSIIVPKINHLNDTHMQLMVRLVGEDSNVIICLARDPPTTTDNPSAVYISYDYGDTFENKTDLFKVTEGSHMTYATLERFYNHPKYNTHLVFTDVKNKLLYVTTNHGRDIKKIELDFTPSEVSFHELEPSVFVVLDKQDPMHRLWVTKDFGNTFKQTKDSIKNLYWVKKSDVSHTLVVQRMEPNEYNTILYSNNLFLNGSDMVLATDIRDFYFKGDYLFTTKLSSRGVLELYISHKLGEKVKCMFETPLELEIRSFFIVDVTSNRALVAISHSDMVSHLYVSENLDSGNEVVKFTLSLEDVLCYFPNSTWHNTWIQHASEDPFADVYKVKGLSGIYIASRVTTKRRDNYLTSEHLASVITFDHGRSWRLIVAPDRDIEGQPNSCSVHNNCSLHLTQKFNQLRRDTRSIGILSSQSAPGIIIATGVLGKSLGGYYDVYISDDAGLTWRQTLREVYSFNMGDHGGILTAVKYFNFRGVTRYLLYSTDVGENWQQVEFHSEDIKPNWLMTEEGENTTVFMIFGSLPQEHKWLIVKLDLIEAFKYNCSLKDDYKVWFPSQTRGERSYIPCVLGQQLTFHRRIPHANCYNGKNLDAPISMTSCGCDFYDYECDFGYGRSKTLDHCVRNTSIEYDPYKVPLTCKPGEFYKRTKGYRKIQGDVCIDGFENQYMPEDVPCPSNKVQEFLLIAQKEKITKYNLVTQTLEELPVKNLRNVVAIDFDMKNNCLYWADSLPLATIRRQCFSSNESEILVSSDLKSIEGIALDWISHTLYFVDGIRSKIELIWTDVNHSGRKRHTVLGPINLKKPRGIALHPKAGYMFWTDWSDENPSVNRADLDGRNVKKLFGKPRVEWPNGVTIDYIAERIYWVDARQDYIASSDLHGDYFKLIVSHNEFVSHPFGIAVFKNNMYWNDWKFNSIFSADKDDFRGVKVLLKNLPLSMELKVYAHDIQIGSNACTNTSCSYICVGKPGKEQKSCLCPDGMELQNGKCMCPGTMEPLPNLTCPRVQNTCSSHQFMCLNGFCLPKSWKCDGEDDCGDSSDESNCSVQTCPSNYFVCGDGKCLPQYWRCDYDDDCSDGSDEKDCPRKNCDESQFTCNNDRCISAKWRCDGENDCRDGSDEQNCNGVVTPTCKSNEFTCKLGTITCIPLTWQCDGEKDCKDGSDERYCTNLTCPYAQFACGEPDNKCIYSSWVCDGDKDCPNGKDEANCTTTASKNGNVTDSKNGLCEDWMFKCANQKCILPHWKCDDVNDCDDGSDELGCRNTKTTTIKPTVTPCPSNQYQCASGPCIPSWWVCDGTKDCIGGEDERQCSNVVNCTKDQFRCHRDGSCISKKLVCNRQVDCPDGSDEQQECYKKLLNGSETSTCSEGYFPCDEYRCYPFTKLCDGKADCVDGYDELNCTKHSSVYQLLQMGVDERGINESTLLLYWRVSTPSKDRLEFMPSISTAGVNEWHNISWIETTEFMFQGLEPATKYNMTIYVRIQNTTKVLPSDKYFSSFTEEGVPSRPWNVTAVQQNGSYVLLSWEPPVQPKGQVVNYQIYWYPPLPPTKLKLSGNETAHLLPGSFEPNVTYSFYVIAHNGKHEGEKSEVTTLEFDDGSNVMDVE